MWYNHHLLILSRRHKHNNLPPIILKGSKGFEDKHSCGRFPNVSITCMDLSNEAGVGVENHGNRYLCGFHSTVD
jgi:hypothetical protein